MQLLINTKIAMAITISKGGFAIVDRVKGSVSNISLYYIVLLKVNSMPNYSGGR